MDLQKLFAKAIAPVSFQFEGETYHCKRIASAALFDNTKRDGETDAQFNDRRLNEMAFAVACTAEGAMVFDPSKTEHVEFVAKQLPVGLKAAYSQNAAGIADDPNGSTAKQDAS